MPTTPGIRWELTGKTFTKSSMRKDVSYGSLQWLYYIQATAPYLRQQDGTRAIIAQGYHQGERQINGIGNAPFFKLKIKQLLVGPVDGYVVVDGVVHIYEYLGCKHHGCDCGVETNEAKRKQDRVDWERKRVQLKKRGKLHAIWECAWKDYMKSHPEILDTKTHIPHIMRKRQTEAELLAAIKDGSFFGYVFCDLW